MSKWVMMVVLAWGLQVSAEYRDFMSTDGKAIRGKVLRVDGAKNTVTIERDNGRSATVPISVFSDADKDYIREWMRFEGVRSTSKLKISCDRRTIKNWDKEQLGTIRYTNGSVEKDQVVGKYDYKSIGYDVKLKNNNSYDLNELTLKYCIFYEQDESKGPLKGVKSGSIDLGTLKSRKEETVSMDPVVVFKYESDSSFIRPVVLKGEVKGACFRIYTKDNEGQSIVLREVSVPDSLMKSHAWRDSSTAVGANRK